MKSWILIIYLFAESLFFGTLSLFSITYDTTSNLYIYFNIFLVSIIIFVLFYHLLTKFKNGNYGVPYSKYGIITLIIFLFIFILISYCKFNSSVFVLKTLEYFIGFTVPAVFLALSISVKDILDIDNKLKYVNLYISICFTISLLKNRHLGMLNDIGGANHLLVGYTMSALFAYNLLKFINNKKITGKIFHSLLMVFNILLIVFSGSRGSLVSVAIIFFIASFKYLLNKKRIIMLCVIIFIIFGAVKIISVNENFDFAIDRMLSVFDLEEDQSSKERFILYNTVMESFEENPIIGNGIGSFSNKMGKYYYPHNIVLEILNDFGIIGITFTLFIFSIVFKRSKYIFKANSKFHLLIFLFINIFVQLMFSGSYLVNSQFWAIITLVLTVSKNEIDINENELKNLSLQ